MASVAMDAYGICVRDDYIYVVSGYDGLWIYDFSDPLQPATVGHCSVPGHCWNIAVANDHAYLAAGGEGMQIVDVSSPQEPTLRGAFDIERQYFRYLCAYGSYVYLPNYSYGLLVIDVTNPDAPYQATACQFDFLPARVNVVGDRLYVGTVAPASSENGLVILDLADPRDPVPIVEGLVAGFVSDVHADGALLYLANYWSMLVMSDMHSHVDRDQPLDFGSRLALSVPSLPTSSVEIVLSLAAPGRVRVDALDVTGRRWATLCDGDRAAGTHRLQWNSPRIPSGQYFIRAALGRRIATRAVTIIR
jgi:hypothetical protein